MLLCALLLAVDPIALLKDADRGRGGSEEGLIWNVQLTATEGGNTSTRAFEVKARGDDALAEATTPPRNKGEIMLFNDRTIWFVKPGLRKPVSISARQKLSGEAANGDIASTNYARDYEPALAGEETVRGEKTYKLELKAKGKNVTYDRIRYWISDGKHLGVKAEFLTLAGEVFKTAEFEYGNMMESRGQKFPFVSRMTIRDAGPTGDVTVIDFTAPKSSQLAAAQFNINNVMR
jgi:outer membrane lipoprotein-sorting protein